ncbi:zinc protease PQQL-like, partial [Vigna unguiculata]|uniref:zinc protease PQQL-like n=1 Tax=Vigna unguiculata TaxID=3917 RepID=UPI00101712FF
LTLDNGFRYYVRCNSKPRMRAALALAVRAGSVLEEEEDERGIAHIVEHLAFSATKKYTNHDIVKFLESIGAEFGACQNAVTFTDDTVYELLVSVDKPELLSQAISELSTNRFGEYLVFVVLPIKGSFGDAFRPNSFIILRPILRQIGFILNINNSFSTYWVVVPIIRHRKTPCPQGDSELITNPTTPKCEDEKRVTQKELAPTLDCSSDSVKFPNISGGAQKLGTKLFAEISDRVVMLRQDSTHAKTRGICFNKKWRGEIWEGEDRSSGHSTFKSLKGHLRIEAPLEVVPAKNDDKTPLGREIHVGIFEKMVWAMQGSKDAHWMLMMEGSKYAERLPIGLEKVIRTVSSETVKHFYKKWYHLCNMAVIAVGDFSDTQELEYSNIGATELVLSNGMQICYKRTDFLDDQVIFTWYSYEGLSELAESEYFSCSMRPTIAGEIGVFGYRPFVLMDMLAGKRAEVGTKIGAYMRTFYGDCSPSDLETALQLVLVYQLFTTNLTPGEEDVKIVMQMVEEAVSAQDRDPYIAFTNRVKELNYGNSYFFRPIRKSDLQKVDPRKACEFFSTCFKDPSTFIVVIVGNIDPRTQNL